VRCAPRRAAGPSRAARRGLTLVEILAVLSIIAVISGVAIAGTMQLPSAQLRGAATMLTSAVKVAFTRATATSRDLRLVMDLDHQTVWLEESSVPMLVQSKDKSATGGADAVTQAEKEALIEHDQILQGPPIPKPKFHPVNANDFGDAHAGAKQKYLGRAVSFRSVQTGHDDEPRTKGRAYLYFWPGGYTERASIQLQIGEDTVLTLLIAPLTGKVTVKAGAVELQIPTDDDQASDRAEAF
jgi:general secretion pathway protein H